jgi:predicted nucleic acid-binding protein
MRLVADANVYLAVALNEPERQGIIEATRGRELTSPEALPFEIGNALSSLIRRGKLSLREAQAAWQACSAITVELRRVDVDAALELAARHGIYAYDAYYLQCAASLRSPLLTLDQRLVRVAVAAGVRVMEVRR